jgi:hypothetical protein
MLRVADDHQRHHHGVRLARARRSGPARRARVPAALRVAGRRAPRAHRSACAGRRGRAVQDHRGVRRDDAEPRLARIARVRRPRFARRRIPASDRGSTHPNSGDVQPLHGWRRSAPVSTPCKNS